MSSPHQCSQLHPRDGHLRASWVPWKLCEPLAHTSTLSAPSSVSPPRHTQGSMAAPGDLPSSLGAPCQATARKQVTEPWADLQKDRSGKGWGLAVSVEAALPAPGGSASSQDGHHEPIP